jgi:hypothetical protein
MKTYQADCYSNVYVKQTLYNEVTALGWTCFVQWWLFLRVRNDANQADILV